MQNARSVQEALRWMLENFGSFIPIAITGGLLSGLTTHLLESLGVSKSPKWENGPLHSEHFRFLRTNSLCNGTYQSIAADNACPNEEDSSMTQTASTVTRSRPRRTFGTWWNGRLATSSMFSRNVRSNCVTTQSAKRMVRAQRSENTHLSKIPGWCDVMDPSFQGLSWTPGCLLWRSLSRMITQHDGGQCIVISFVISPSAFYDTGLQWSSFKCITAAKPDRKRKNTSHQSSCPVLLPLSIDLFLFLKSTPQTQLTSPAAAAPSVVQDCIRILWKEASTRRTGDKESVHTEGNEGSTGT